MKHIASLALAAGLLVPAVLLPTLAASASETAAPLKPVYFSDCSHLLFDSRGREELTRAERIRMMDTDIKSNLGNYELCIAAALNSSRERLSEVSPPAGAQSSSMAQTSAVTLAENEDEEATEEQAKRASAPSKPHVQGQRQGGSSSVCDAIRAGLESATTDKEREHFQSLATEYGC